MQKRRRSFVRRGRRKTTAQERAYNALWPRFGLQLEHGMVSYTALFGRQAPCLLEIGFGTGRSLIELARLNPDKDFIAVETHQPGIGALLLGMSEHGLTNIRIYEADVVDVLEQCIPHGSLEGIQIFFPDPWPKRRHQPRRLIQAPFISQCIDKLKINGTLHLATDWEDYALQMMQTLSLAVQFTNLFGKDQFATRSLYRPILSKFESRAQREGRKVWELQFAKRDSTR